MIQAGNSPQVAALNYRNEVGLDVYLDMKSEVEELLKACEPHKQEHKGMGAVPKENLLMQS